MFLQKYVQEVDEQLARLIAARDKIASLAGPPTQLKFVTMMPSVAAAEETAAVPTALEADDSRKTETVTAPAKRRGRPKGSRNNTTMVRTHRQAAPEPRALSSTVPVGPVVISPAQLAKRHEPVALKVETSVAKPEMPGGGLDALIRELTERRVTAFSSAA